MASGSPELRDLGRRSHDYDDMYHSTYEAYGQRSTGPT